MKISSVIQSIQSNSTKTASAAPVATVAPSSIQEALRTVVETTKTASALAPSSPTVESVLQKEAAALTASEDAAYIARSKLAGAAFAETFVSELNRASVASGEALKTAAAEIDPMLLKVALELRDNPVQALNDIQAGIAAQQTKVAGDDFLDRVHGANMDHYYRGYDSLAQALKA